MKKLISSILFLSIVIFSCKKNNTDVTPTVTIPKVKNYAIGGEDVIYTYDAQGRILTRINTTSNWKYEYVYGTNVVTENYYSVSTLSTTVRIELQSNGLAKRTFSAGDIYQTAYTYNDNNLVIQRVNTNTLNSNTATEKFFYTGKQLDSTHKTFSYNNDFYRTIYTYYTDKTNTISFKNQGHLFYADQADSPIKQIKYIYSATNTQIQDYAYTYDAQGRIINRIINGGANGTNEITYY